MEYLISVCRALDTGGNDFYLFRDVPTDLNNIKLEDGEKLVLHEGGLF